MADQTDLEQAGAALAGISVLAANVRVICLSERYSFAGAIRASVLALFAGFLCALFIYDLKFAIGWKLGFVSIAGVLAEDLVRALLKVGKRACEKPLEVAMKIVFRE